MEYTIKDVQARDTWSSQYGEFQTYAISLEGVDGWVKLNQKVETRPPQEGSTIFGSIQDKTDKTGKSYKQFKKEQQQPGGGGYSGGGSFQKSSSGKSGGFTPEKEKEIRKLALLKVSAEVFSGKGVEVETVWDFANELEKLMEGPAKTEDTSGKDVVHEVDEEEPINLDDVPF